MSSTKQERRPKPTRHKGEAMTVNCIKEKPGRGEGPGSRAFCVIGAWGAPTWIQTLWQHFSSAKAVEFTTTASGQGSAVRGHALSDPTQLWSLQRWTSPQAITGVDRA